MLARMGWAASLTRDGLARTDILAVETLGDRRMIEVQVKTVTSGSWPLGLKGTLPALSEREWYVFVRLGEFPGRPGTWVVPRDHVAAATWIGHMSWLTDTNAAPGTRNAGIGSARIGPEVFEQYEDAWNLLNASAYEAPVMLPAWMRTAAARPEVGLPDGHPWRDGLPDFATSTAITG